MGSCEIVRRRPQELQPFLLVQALPPLTPSASGLSQAVRVPSRETVFDYWLDVKGAKFDVWKAAPIFKVRGHIPTHSCDPNTVADTHPLRWRTTPHRVYRPPHAPSPLTL